MLSRTQFLWLAEHSRGVRRTVWGMISISTLTYIGAVLWVFWSQGKTPIPYVVTSHHLSDFNCKDAMAAYLIPEADARGYTGNSAEHAKIAGSERSVWRLHLPRVVAIDVNGLRTQPACIGAMLADAEADPNETVFLIVDRQTDKSAYRIEHTK